MHALHELRHEIDHFLGHHPYSPLTPEQRRDFAGLHYYEPDPAYVLAGALERLPETEPSLQMQTSTGDSRAYRRWGVVSLEVDGQPFTITLYIDPDGHELFVPFKDRTNGPETYGAGRYLDSQRPGLRLLDDGRFEIDFNYAYNPYCAYNETYSCPLPPRENWLPVAIRAGEKDFK